MDESTESAVLAKAVAAALEVRNAGAQPFLVVPDGYRIEDLEKFLASPVRQRATVRFETTDSFSAYLNEYGEAGKTHLFASPRSNTVLAILDYHQGSLANWGEHTTTLQLRLSDEWGTWTAKNGQPLTQVAFAEFLEDNIENIVAPAGAEVLEIAKHLEAKRTVQFKSGVNLSNGAVQFTYDENIDGKGKGQVTVPTVFTLGLPVYYGGAPYKVEARLRYRITNDTLTFTYKLIHPERVQEAAFDEVLSAIEEETEFKTLIGSVTIAR